MHHLNPYPYRSFRVKGFGWERSGFGATADLIFGHFFHFFSAANEISSGSAIICPNYLKLVHMLAFDLNLRMQKKKCEIFEKQKSLLLWVWF